MNNEGLQEIAQTSVANILEVGRRKIGRAHV